MRERVRHRAAACLRVLPQLHPQARLSRRLGRPDDFKDERALRRAEIPETSATRVPSPEPRAPLMFSLHVDTARTWRGGQNQVLLTVNGLRSIGHRAALVAHPDGELRRRAAEGLELIPLAPRTEMDLSAAWKFSRLLKRVDPDVVHAHDPHSVAMSALALSFGAGSARGGPAPPLVASRRVDFHLKGNSFSRWK